MKIVTLEPFLTQLVVSLGLAADLRGISHLCSIQEGMNNPLVLTKPEADESSLLADISPWQLDLDLLESISPDIILCAAPYVSGLERDNFEKGKIGVGENCMREISSCCGEKCKLLSFNPMTMEEITLMFEGVGKELGVVTRARELSGRLKAQCMDWADNFYDRIKNKKISFLSSITPLKLGARWIPDLIRLASGQSQEKVSGIQDREIGWQELVDFRPDVILVAPQGKTLEESLKLFKVMEKFPSWEEIPAVKRGEVIFTDGIKHFYVPGMPLIDSMAILISALAGFESGYITARDSFFKLRWLELQRHRFKD